MNSRIALGAAVCAFAALGSAVGGAQTPAGGLPKGAAEIAMAKVAQQSGASADVKSFADRMVADHEKAAAQLATIAASKHLRVNDKLSAKDARELARLQKLDGSRFDREYVHAQVGAHKDAVKLFRKESEGGRDAVLKDFATTTLPTLQDHLTMVTALSTTMH